MKTHLEIGKTKIRTERENSPGKQGKLKKLKGKTHN